MKFFVPNPLFATRRSAIIIVWRKEITTKVKFCVLKRDQELYLSKTELHINFSDPGQLNKTLETSILASFIFNILATTYTLHLSDKGSKN